MKKQSELFLVPDWPAPPSVKAAVTLRDFGNCNPMHAPPSSSLLSTLNLPAPPVWLNQRHGNEVVLLPNPITSLNADGSYTRTENVVCSVVTADCLPLLLCSKDGREIAAVHAGWRGLAAGIIESALSHFQAQSSSILAWLGPAIGADHFEIGEDLYALFTAQNPSNSQHFRQTDPTHWLCDIYGIATSHLQQMGVHLVYGGNHCTWSEKNRFFSYRREKTSNRMANLIWRNS